MTVNIHLLTAQVPQYHVAFQEQTFFWLESFAIDLV